MAKNSDKYFFSQIIGDLKSQKNSATPCSWFLFIFHPSAKVLVKMQEEDPRSSTCCCTAKYFLLGANLHSLNIESVLEGLEIVFDGKWA
jgi:hypothetical protein